MSLYKICDPECTRQREKTILCAIHIGGRAVPCKGFVDSVRAVNLYLKTLWMGIVKMCEDTYRMDRTRHSLRVSRRRYLVTQTCSVLAISWWRRTTEMVTFIRNYSVLWHMFGLRIVKQVRNPQSVFSSYMMTRRIFWVLLTSLAISWGGRQSESVYLFIPL